MCGGEERCNREPNVCKSQAVHGPVGGAKGLNLYRENEKKSVQVFKHALHD